MQIAIVKRPLAPPHCGDRAGYWEWNGKTVLCIIDGLGHGKFAERAALAALDYLGLHHHEPLPEIFANCDKALRHTCGVVMGVAVVDPDAGTLTYAGIGDTRALVNGTERVHLESNYGIVGAGYRKLTPQTVPLAAGDLVIMYTDGVKEYFDMSSYDEALRADVERLAKAIVRDWGHERDDAAALVFKNRGETT